MTCKILQGSKITPLHRRDLPPRAPPAADPTRILPTPVKVASSISVPDFRIIHPLLMIPPAELTTSFRLLRCPSPFPARFNNNSKSNRSFKNKTTVNSYPTPCTRVLTMCCILHRLSESIGCPTLRSARTSGTLSKETRVPLIIKNEKNLSTNIKNYKTTYLKSIYKFESIYTYICSLAVMFPKFN